MATRKPLSKKVRFGIFERDGFFCKYCGRNADSVTLEIDHIHPVSKGGSDEPENLITSCSDCNRGKSAKVLESLPESEHLRLSQERRELEAALKEKAKIAKLRAKRKQGRVNEFCGALGIGSVNNAFLRAIESICNEFGDDQAMKWATCAYLKTSEKTYSVGSESHWTNAAKYLYGIARKVRQEALEGAE